MKPSPLLKRKWNHTALAFVLPVLGLLILRLICTLAFNGTYSMLYSDCYHQYYPFFLSFRRALLSGDSLLYNWEIGMGLDYLGLISYYLASPLNLLSILVPEGMTLAYFSALMPIKLGLASLFFAIFLKKTFRKDDFSIVIFGSFYALCAWALGYQWNIMWLDTFALLPLVVLGMLSLVEKKKFVLYTITLFLSVYANYYIGFFTCIFIFLAFFCYQICRWQGFKKFFADLVRIAFFSALAIGMTAVMSLPTLAALQNTQSSVNKFPEGFKLNIADENTWLGLLDAMRQVAGNMNAAIKPSFKEGLPNLYCGIFTNIFAFLFLTSRQVKLRDKLCTVFLLLLFNLSFIIRQLDYIWHGFHFTNMIPYRFSFLYSFVMLFVAYRAWLLRQHFRPWQLVTAGVLSLGLVLCSESLTGFVELVAGQLSLQAWSGTDNINANLEAILTACVFPAVNLIFLIVYPIVLGKANAHKPIPEKMTRKQKCAWLAELGNRRQLASAVLLGIMAIELVLNLVNFGRYFPGTNVKNYPKGTEDTENAVTYMQQLEEDTLFYRAEVSHVQTFNDGALNGYNGITTFTSSANVNVTEFMKALGYGAKNTYNRYAFEEASPVANLFLNLKYMIERDGGAYENAYFNDIYSSGNVHLLENNAYLPLGFLADPQLVNVEFTSDGDRFTFQNELMRAATGVNVDVWHYLNGSNLTILGSDVTLSAQVDTGYCSYTVGNSDGTITYSYTADREGLLCFYWNQSKKNKLKVYLNGSEEPLYSETYSLPQMLSVCNVVPGDVVEIKLTCTANEKGTIDLSAAILDEEMFRLGYDVLAASTLELTSFSNTCVEGTINCDRDGVLYTSIPQNGNWSATVDGEPAQIVLIGDAMCGLLLSEGTHTVRFTYRNEAFSLGWKISLGCAVVFVGIYWAVYQPKLNRRKGKYEQNKK